MRDPLREAERWVRQADVDLGAARRLADDFSALACFHAQQAGEKALKAILYASGERVVLGHSLTELGAAVERRTSDYGPLRGEVAKLDRYYVPTRYPNGLPAGGDPSEAFDAEDARSAIRTAERALDHARAFVTSTPNASR
jgi:HEPN domain-containing protein